MRDISVCAYSRVRCHNLPVRPLGISFISMSIPATRSKVTTFLRELLGLLGIWKFQTRTKTSFFFIKHDGLGGNTELLRGADEPLPLESGDN